MYTKHTNQYIKKLSSFNIANTLPHIQTHKRTHFEPRSITIISCAMDIFMCECVFAARAQNESESSCTVI